MDDSSANQRLHDDEPPATERPEPAAPGDIDDAAADDFAARNVLMSNAFGGGASPFAGALIGNKEKFLEPTSDEERVTDTVPESKATRVEPAPDTKDRESSDPRGI